MGVIEKVPDARGVWRLTEQGRTRRHWPPSVSAGAGSRPRIFLTTFVRVRSSSETSLSSRSAQHLRRFVENDAAIRYRSQRS